MAKTPANDAPASRRRFRLGRRAGGQTAPSPAGRGSASRGATGPGGRTTRGRAAKPEPQDRRLAQLRTAFRLTRKRDKRLVPYLLLSFVGTIVVFEIVGTLLSDIIVFSVFGVLFAVMLTFFIFGRRAQSSAYAEVAGQPGAAAAVVENMRGDWRLTPNVAATRNFDVVHRVVGRPGVILIGEGSTNRLQPLIADQKKRIQRVAAETPIHEFVVGTEPGQVPLIKLQRKLTRLPRMFKGSTVDQIEARMRALGTLNVPIPKGPLPKGVRIPKNARPPR